MQKSDKPKAYFYSSVKLGFERDVHLVLNGRDEERFESTYQEVDPEIFVKLARYEAMGSPDEISAVLEGHRDELIHLRERSDGEKAALREMCERTNDQLRGRVRALEAVVKDQDKRFIDPAKATVVDYIVLLVNRLIAEPFAALCDIYDRRFPGGLDEDIRIALERDERGYVLSKEEVRELAMAEHAGIMLVGSLDEIILIADDRSGPFEESGYFHNMKFNYLGAMATIINAEQEKKKHSPLVDEKTLQEARAVKEEFEEARDGWGARQAAAARLRHLIVEYRELYTIANKITPQEKLDITIPIGTFAAASPEGKTIYFVLPTDKGTAQRNLTREVYFYLLASVKEALEGIATPALREMDGMGTRVYGAFIPQKDLSADAFLRTVEQKYNTHALAKLGVRLQMYACGDRS